MRYSVPDHVLEENVGDEVVLLSLQRETFFSLNASGIALWTEIRAGHGDDRLNQLLIERYSLDAAQAKADVSAFVGELIKLDLLSVADSAGADAA